MEKSDFYLITPELPYYYEYKTISSQAVTRLRGGQLILNGYDNDEIIDIVETSRSFAKRWKRKLKEHNNDLACLVREKDSGRPAKLNNVQKSQLKEIILAGAVAAGYPTERWTSKIVADLILKIFGITMADRTVRYLLRALHLSPQMPAVKSNKHSDDAVIEWASRTWKRLKKNEATRHALDFLGRKWFLAFTDFLCTMCASYWH